MRFALCRLGMYTRGIKHPGRDHIMSKRIGRYVWAEPKDNTSPHTQGMGDIYVVTEHKGGDLYGVKFHWFDQDALDAEPVVTVRISGKLVDGAWPGNDDTLLGIIV